MAVFSTIAATFAAISTVGFSSAMYAFASSLTGKILLSFAANALIGALSPKPSSAGSDRGYQTNTSGTALDHQIVYGEVKVGGAILFDETTGSDNKYLHRIIGVAGHEIESFERIYINDEYIDVSDIPASGNIPLVYSSDGSTTSDRYNGKITINFHLGSPDQLADTDLVAASSKWTSLHRLRGIAYMYIKMEYDQDSFPNGIPVFTATVKGKKVKNPSTGLTAWSDNPALCLRDYLTTTGYGLGETEDNIDDDLVNAAVAICNETNTIAGTKRYTCNGSFTTGSTPYDTISNLLTSMGGTMWYAQGKWRMKPAYWTAPVMDLNEDDFRSSVAVSTRHSRRDNFNTIKGTFRGEETNWMVTDYPQRTKAAFVTADGGQESVADVNLSFTDTSIEARRLALITLERNRQQLTINASFGLRTLGLQVGDNVRITNTRFGWTNKPFEVVSWNFGLTDGLDLQTQMTLRETSESVFDEVADGIVYERDNTNLPSPFDGLGVTNLAVNGGGRTQSDGTFINSAIFSWDAADSAFVSYYKVEWKPLADSNYSSTTTTGTSVELSPIIDAVEYVFRVQAISVLGNGGSISSVTYTVGGDISAPNVPTNLSAEAGYKYITVDFDLPTASDFNRVEIYEGTSTNFAAAVSIGFTSGNRFVRTGLGNNATRYYWVRSQDHSGNNSAFVGPVNATTFLVEQTDLTQSLIDTIEAAGVSAVNSLPATGDFDGQIVFLLTDNTLYRWDEAGGVWSKELYTGIEDGSVTRDKIVDDAISAAKIATDAVTSIKIATGSITETKISSGAITTPKIAAGAITANEIAANSITSDKIVAGTIQASDIAANSITANKLAANSVTASEISAGAVTAAKISAGAVTTDKLVAGAVVASKIAAGAVTADKLNVSELSAITAQIGTFSSAASGARLVLQDDKILVYDSSNVIRVKIGNLA